MSLKIRNGLFSADSCRACFLLLVIFAISSCDNTDFEKTDDGSKETSKTRPNIIYILADDLGYNELGSYGQDKIITPTLDQMANDGMRFTQHYSGSTVCAPSRSVLMTGQDTGRTYIRGNQNAGIEIGQGQLDIKDGTRTLAAMLQEAGYKTGLMGKWGLGSLGTPGHPNNKGFDHFFGYLDQRTAHNYYPEYLWRNSEKIDLNNPPMPRPPNFSSDANDVAAYHPFKGSDYASDLIAEEVKSFVKEHKDNPFFVYWALTVPHAALQVPDEELVQYEGKFDEEPYLALGSDYFPHIRPRSAHAAQITRMDRNVGSVLNLLKELELDDETVVIFTSDNGPGQEGGMDQEFFDGNGIYRGVKRDLYEGGIRVPMIVRWPGKVKKGSSSDHISAFWDVMATFADIASATVSETSHGISFFPELTGQGVQKKHESLYWEFHEGGGKQAARMGKWKAIRLNVQQNNNAPIELYNLEIDPSETTDVSDNYPDIVNKMNEVMSSRTSSFNEDWNF